MLNVGQIKSLRSPIILFQGWVSSVRRCICSIAVTTDDDSEFVDIAAGAQIRRDEGRIAHATCARKDKIVKNG